MPVGSSKNKKKLGKKSRVAVGGALSDRLKESPGMPVGSSKSKKKMGKKKLCCETQVQRPLSAGKSLHIPAVLFCKNMLSSPSGVLIINKLRFLIS